MKNEKEFRPAYIGDPLKLSASARRIRQGPALASGAVWIGGNFLCGAVLSALDRATIPKDQQGSPADNLPATGQYIHGKNSMLVNAMKLLTLGGIGYASSVLSQYIYGSKYNYMGYKVPPKGSDVVIAFTGAGSGAARAKGGRQYDMDVMDLDARYGRGHYALFNYNDMSEAMDYISNLPEGCRIRIQGHSKGGPAALRLARYASENGIPVDRLDTLDPVGMQPDSESKPSLVKTWENHLPKRTHLAYWPDLVALMGHRKREYGGARNLYYDTDHTGIRSVDFAKDRKKDYDMPMSADSGFGLSMGELNEKGEAVK